MNYFDKIYIMSFERFRIICRPLYKQWSEVFVVVLMLNGARS